MNWRTILTAGWLALGTAASHAGDGYEITSTDGTKPVTYKVNFGGGRRFEQWTAFDPAAKAFVYLRWPRGTPAPAPAATIWDHRTGETVPLYKFPGVNSPLPVIPSVDAMKACPLTGDKSFRAKRVLAYD